MPIIRVDHDVNQRVQDTRVILEQAWGRRVTRNETLRQFLGLHIEGAADEALTPFADEARP